MCVINYGYWYTVADFSKLAASPVGSFDINGTSYAVNVRFVLPNFYNEPIRYYSMCHMRKGFLPA